MVKCWREKPCASSCEESNTQSLLDSPSTSRSRKEKTPCWPRKAGKPCACITCWLRERITLRNVLLALLSLLIMGITIWGIILIFSSINNKEGGNFFSNEEAPDDRENQEESENPDNIQEDSHEKSDRHVNSDEIHKHNSEELRKFDTICKHNHITHKKSRKLLSVSKKTEMAYDINSNENDDQNMNISKNYDFFTHKNSKNFKEIEKYITFRNNVDSNNNYYNKMYTQIPKSNAASREKIIKRNQSENQDINRVKINQSKSSLNINRLKPQQIIQNSMNRNEIKKTYYGKNEIEYKAKFPIVNSDITSKSLHDYVVLRESSDSKINLFLKYNPEVTTKKCKESSPFKKIYKSNTFSKKNIADIKNYNQEIYHLGGKLKERKLLSIDLKQHKIDMIKSKNQNITTNIKIKSQNKKEKEIKTQNMDNKNQEKNGNEVSKIMKRSVPQWDWSSKMWIEKPIIIEPDDLRNNIDYKHLENDPQNNMLDTKISSNSDLGNKNVWDTFKNQNKGNIVQSEHNYKMNNKESNINPFNKKGKDADNVIIDDKNEPKTENLKPARENLNKQDAQIQRRNSIITRPSTVFNAHKKTCKKLDPDSAKSSQMMQKLVTLLEQVVDNQVSVRTCLHLSADLRDFLSWVTSDSCPGTLPNYRRQYRV